MAGRKKATVDTVARRAALLVKRQFDVAQERAIEQRAESWPAEAPADAKDDVQAWAYVLALVDDTKPK